MQEPDFIADLCINWASELMSILKLVLTSKFQVSLTSVFCHQKPLADFGQKPRPELGDLLLVFKFADKKKLTTINSLLLQAKMSSSPQIHVPAGDTQLHLYEKWPKYKYARAAHLNGCSRDIFPKTTTQGAKYLLIDPSSIFTLEQYGTFTYGCAMTNSLLTLNSDLASEIISFLQFINGRNIDNNGNITEDWSQMIWDLLSITKGKMTRRKNMGIGNFPRQATSNFDGCYFINIDQLNSSYYSDIIDELGGDYTNGNLNEDDGGVSTVFIEINENE
ncbi:hypothetical protein GCM10009122_22740 [Fulvivirga kasyanovii]